jgi:hypothetical protein
LRDARTAAASTSAAVAGRAGAAGTADAGADTKPWEASNTSTDLPSTWTGRPLTSQQGRRFDIGDGGAKTKSRAPMRRNEAAGGGVASKLET